MKSFFIATLLVLTCAGSSYAQDADPAVNLSVSPNTIAQGSTTTLTIQASNLGNSAIVANSLEVIVTVGNNVRITGLASGSDARWTVYTSTTGAGNTYTLRNTDGGVASFNSGSIRLSAVGVNMGTNVPSVATIAYIPGSNANIPGSAPSSIQGNGQTNNDTSRTTMSVIPGVALSTQLLSFTGEAHQCDAALTWTVTATSGTLPIELQSSADGRAFTPVETAVMQTGSGIGSYKVVVAQNAAKSYYRLKLTDGSGASIWSQTISVLTNCTLSQPVTLFPNPVKQTAVLSGLAAGDVIGLYNSLGQQVRTVISTGPQASLDLQGLAAGIYQAVITGTDQPITIPVLKVD